MRLRHVDPYERRGRQYLAIARFATTPLTLAYDEGRETSIFGFSTRSPGGLARAFSRVYRSRHRSTRRERRDPMAYVVRRRDRWYAVANEGTDQVTGRDRRR